MHEPPKSWPPYLLKVLTRLLASTSPSLWPLSGLVCELFGQPPSASASRRAVRITSLGEAGNATLAAGFASAEAAFAGRAGGRGRQSSLGLCEG